MNLTNEFSPIREWATNKGIYKEGDLVTQIVKLTEEVGELCSAALSNDVSEIEDAIGDIAVVLTSVAELANKKYGGNITIESCISGAYNVIKNRTGKMENGTFKKDEGNS